MTLNVEDFGPFTLSANSHNSPAEGMCVMEMVSFLAGEEWSDMPPCSSPVVARFCQVINDRMGQDVRDRLQTYVPRLIGTVSPEHDQERAEYLAWAAIRKFAPIALDAAGMTDHAERLRNFEGTLEEARAAARAADHAAARAAAHAAARAAADAAAHTADAAADAATHAAAHTADAAAHTADAAADAATRAAATEAMFEVLDGLLEIGPSGSAYTEEHLSRVEPLRKATKQFA